jgi:membrane-associated phospholipid phosphatase
LIKRRLREQLLRRKKGAPPGTTLAPITVDDVYPRVTFSDPKIVTPLTSFPQSAAAMAVANPLAHADDAMAAWFHARLTWPFVHLLRVLSEPGSAEWIGFALFLGVAVCTWKRAWPALTTLLVAVPGGMLLNELIKLGVHRHRPFVDGAFVDWSGYSFASGHTIGATLLYGQLVLFLLPLLKSRRWQCVTVTSATGLIAIVGFSRIALGAHYFSDVLAAVVFGSSWLLVCAFGSKAIRRTSVLGHEQSIILPAAALPADVGLAAAELMALSPAVVESQPTAAQR